MLIVMLLLIMVLMMAWWWSWCPRWWWWSHAHYSGDLPRFLIWLRSFGCWPSHKVLNCYSLEGSWQSCWDIFWRQCCKDILSRHGLYMTMTVDDPLNDRWPEIECLFYRDIFLFTKDREEWLSEVRLWYWEFSWWNKSCLNIFPAQRCTLLPPLVEPFNI